MSTQIAVRLPDDVVEFIDELVTSGRATSRAEVVSRALLREQRREAAARDVSILSANRPNRDLERLSEFVVGRPLDLD